MQVNGLENISLVDTVSLEPLAQDVNNNNVKEVKIHTHFFIEKYLPKNRFYYLYCLLSYYLLSIDLITFGISLITSVGSMEYTDNFLAQFKPL